MPFGSPTQWKIPTHIGITIRIPLLTIMNMRTIMTITLIRILIMATSTD